MRCQKYVSHQRPGGHLCFPIGPKIYEIGGGRRDLTSFQVPFRSIQRFKIRFPKCPGQSEAG